MSVVEIPVQTELDLDAVLDRLPTAVDLRWAILEMWAVGVDDTVDIAALEAQAHASPTGLELSGPQLREVAGRLHQLVDGIVVGFRGRPPLRSDPDLRTSCEVVIEAVDSTFWRIYAAETTMLDRLRTDFDDVRTGASERPIRPAHPDS